MPSTVDRVLPWRRPELTPDEEVAPVVEAFREHHPRSGSDLIVRSYRRAAEAHEGQQRKSGDPYITHPLAVAKVTADLGLDDTTIAAALLHDAVEDTRVALAEIDDEFGPEVAAIVDGVTKLERLEFESREAQQAATMRKMLVAMADDLRVLMVKLADRLHNMRTLAAMPTEKQLRIAQETLDIYAPLAHRLGVQEVKQQLEDLAFAALHPKRFAEIDHLVDARAPERDLYLTQVEGEVTERLAEVRVKADVTGRPKHLWSIYEKMVRGRPFDDILDLVGIRVIVASVKDCYAALGCIHGMWQPVTGRFKDYIALPKFNLYQSLHTTVMGPGGKAVEFQIRTQEMHQRAELGVAAHWAYKEKSPADDIVWLNKILDWQTETTDPTQFMANLKGDLEDNEVYVFTPKGDVIILPDGATPLDFAYAIHTEVGHACIGARIDGRLVPLDSALKSGSTVEVITSKVENPGPSRDWLNIVVTPRAQNRIRQWFSRERRGDAIEAGRDDVIKTLRREGLPLGTEVLEAVAADLKFADLDSLFVAVGEHHVVGQVRGQPRPAHALGQRPGAGGAALHRPHHAPPAPPLGQSAGPGPRGGPGADAGPPVPVLHPGAGRRDHGLHHPGAGRHRPPHRLHERGGPGPGADRAGHRRRVGHREPRDLRGQRGGRGHGPGTSPDRRLLGAVGPPPQHPPLRDPHRRGSDVSHAVRRRAR